MHETVEVARLQQGLITRAQALDLLTPAQIRTRLAGRWQRVLPGVYAVFTGDLTFVQRCRAALLFCGDGALLNDTTALRLLGAKYLPPDSQTRVLIPQERNIHSREWLTVRRTHYSARPTLVAGLPCVPAARALAELAVRWPDTRDSLAVTSWVLTKRLVTPTDLDEAWQHLPRSGGGGARRVLAEVRRGVRSVGELDFVELVGRSRRLPEPRLNWLLELPDGRRISPDALFDSAGLVHETNGRDGHGDEDPFESMQARHDALTVAGFAVLHNTPRQIRTEGRRIVTEVERLYRVREGIGLPPGVRVLRTSA